MAISPVTMQNDTYYSIKELIRLTIVESDNTSFIKLVKNVALI